MSRTTLSTGCVGSCGGILLRSFLHKSFFPHIYVGIIKAWFVQSTKLVLAVTGRRGAEPAAEDLPCGRLGEEPTKNLARGALSVDALFEWP